MPVACVHAVDKTRCRLSTIPGETGSDYINASHIDVSRYIHLRKVCSVLCYHTIICMYVIDGCGNFQLLTIIIIYNYHNKTIHVGIAAMTTLNLSIQDMI